VQFKIEIQSESIMTNSERLFEEAQKFIPGGVNSPVRAFRQVGGTPLFMKSANGAYLVDADGKQYIDYIGSWGPMILGHSHPKVVEAIKLQVEQAVSFGAPTEQETSLAKLISQMVPGIDLIRFVNSGTEACMSALRLARGFTNRSKFIKFEGHYHGHSDAFLKKAGSGVATLNIKVNAGIPSAVVDDTLVASFNNFEEIEKLVEKLDAQPPSVMIQCLIAQITLTNTNEFGVELGHELTPIDSQELPTSYASVGHEKPSPDVIPWRARDPRRHRRAAS